MYFAEVLARLALAEILDYSESVPTVLARVRTFVDSAQDNF